MAFVSKKFPHMGDQVLNFAIETDYGVVPGAPTWKGLHILNANGFKMNEASQSVRFKGALSGSARSTTKSLLSGIDVTGTYETPLIKADLADLFTIFERSSGVLSSFVFDHASRSDYDERFTGVKCETARFSGSNPGEITLSLDLVGRARVLPTGDVSQSTLSSIDPYLFWGFVAEVDGVFWHDIESFDLTIGHALQKGPYRSVDHGISHLEEGDESVTGSLTGVFSQETLRNIVNSDTLFQLDLYFQEDIIETDGTPVTDAGALKITVYKCRVTDHPLDSSGEEFTAGTVSFEAEADPANSYQTWAKTLPV